MFLHTNKLYINHVAASQFQLSKIDSILPWPECKICTVQDLALNTKQEKHENEPDQISLLHFPAFETFCSSYQDCWDMVLQQVTHTASPQHEVVKRASYIVAFEPLTLLSTCTATTLLQPQVYTPFAYLPYNCSNIILSTRLTFLLCWENVHLGQL